MSDLLETLTSYVPTLVVKRLEADPTHQVQARLEASPAAVLFADISGFTALTERLARLGPAGAEALTRYLNAYFGELIDVISAHGGDVVKFAGDALIALWQAGEGGLAEAACLAARCGLAVQERLADYRAGEEVRLSLRVKVGAGEAFSVPLGGVYGRWELLVAGEPFLQIREAGRTVEPGRVVLSQEAWALVRDRATGRPVGPDDGPGSGAVRLEAIDAPAPAPATPPAPAPRIETALKAFIPGAILSRLSAGQTAWLAELRRLTILFVHLPGIGRLARSDLERAQATLRAAQSAVYHYEGSINKLNADDKGNSLVVVFGLPPLFHEDDAVRGVQAAIQLRAALETLGFPCAIGITTGRAFCGSVGAPTRREYTIMGDVVNLSARLMQAADGDILCDDATFQAARARVAFDVLPPITVKGKADPVTVFRPVGSAPAAMRPVQPMVGRARELEVLSEQLEALLRTWRSSVTLIEGEAGIGKSRLIEEVHRRARSLGLRVLIGGGDAVEKNSSYHPWRSIFAQLLELENVVEPEVRRARVLARLASRPGLEERAPLLNPVLGIDLPDNPLTRDMTGQVRADNTRDLLVELLQCCLEAAPGTVTPGVLILEDAHWLDSASWHVASGMSRQLTAVAMVVATRPPVDPVPKEYLELLQRPDSRHLRLEPLPPADSIALVCQRLGVSSLPEAVAELIRERAEGHPFFSEELAYALRDAGLILIEGGSCRIAPDAGDLRALSLPDTVEGAITSRIDRLTPPQQLTIKVASVIGRVFSLRILRDIHPIDADRPHLREQLAALQRLDLTPLEAPEPELQYIFKHVITQEVAYNLMLFGQRRELHRGIAEWHERTHRGDLAPYYPVLAWHWSQAVDENDPESTAVARAFEYLELAGSQALRAGAYREAAEFLREALQRSTSSSPVIRRHSPPERRGAWLARLGRAERGLGLLREARRDLEAALALLDRPVARTLPGLVLITLWQMGAQAWHRLAPGRVLGTATGAEAQALLELAAACKDLGAVYWMTAYRAFLYVTLRHLNLSERAGPSGDLVTAYATMQFVSGLAGLERLSGVYGRRVAEMHQTVQQPGAYADALITGALTHIARHALARACAALDESAAISARGGDWLRWGDALGAKALAQFHQGELQAARATCETLIRASERNGNMYQMLNALTVLSGVALRQGRQDEALPFIERALGLESVSSPHTALQLLGMRALACLRRGEDAQALAAAGQAMGYLEQFGPGPGGSLHVASFGNLAEVYLVAWERGDLRARAPARRICRAIRQFSREPLGRPLASIFQGWYLWLVGNTAGALACWEGGLAAAEAAQVPFEQALAHLELGRRGRGEAAETHLDRAETLFTTLDAGYHLALIGALRQRRQG